MNLTKYKKLSKTYSKFPVPKEVCETPEYEEYLEAFINDKDCQE